MMAGSRKIFEVESDEDSVPTDYTQESETQDTYEVEKILYEQESVQDGQMKWLVKWVGYPLCQATWEPLEHLEEGSVLADWEQVKQEIQEGKQKGFNLKDWEYAVDQYELEKADKDRRRKIKRKKRGLPILTSTEPSVEPSGDESDFDASSVSKPKTKGKAAAIQQQPPATRKGVAQKIRKKRSGVRHGGSSEEESGLFTASSDDDSTRRKAQPPARKKARTQASVPSSDESGDMSSSTESSSGISKSKKVASKKVASSTKPRAPSLSQSQSTSKADQQQQQTAARKSAPSLNATAKSMAKKTKAPNVMGNWDAQKARVKKLPEFTREVKDNHRPAYAFNSRTERPPDVAALTLLDTKTGKPIRRESDGVLAKGATTGSAASLPVEPTQEPRRQSVPSRPRRSPPPPPPPSEPVTELPVAYARRSPPPAARSHERSASPPRNAASMGNKETQWTINRRRHIVCRHWETGRCERSAEECDFAHSRVAQPELSKSHQMCYFWATKGNCGKPVGKCEYAHHHLETGIVARPPPGVARKGTSEDFRNRPQGLTCPYWANGICNRPDDMCAFAHYHTGKVALPPGTFKRDSRRLSSTTPNNGNVPIAPTTTTASKTPLHVPQHDLVQTSGYSSWSPARMTDSPMHESTASPQDFAQAKVSETATLELLHHGSSEPLRIPAEIETVRPLNALSCPLTIKVEQTILAEDVEQHLLRSAMSKSDVMAGTIKIEDTDLSDVIELCDLHSCGLVAAVDGLSSKLVIYPTESVDWQFMSGQTLFETPGGTPLSYVILDGLRDLGTSVVGGTPRPDMPAVAEGGANSDFEWLFARYLETSDHHQEAAFLMIPPHHATELEIYAKLTTEKYGKVYHAGTKGAWSHFRKKYLHQPCFVVLHPSVNLCQIPGWHDFVKAAPVSAQFYTIGTGGRPWYPHGTVVLITDEVFLCHPEKATKVIQHYLNSTSSKPEGKETNRIAARPGLKQWLLETFIEPSGKAHPKWINLYGAVCDLLPLEAEDSEGNPLPGAHLVCPSPDELASFADLNDSNRAVAQEALVGWFAAWAAVGETKFRRVVVCHEPKGMDEGQIAETHDPRGWARKYQNLVVWSPEGVAKDILPFKQAQKGTRYWPEEPPPKLHH